jgi:hypothetical protein
MAIASLSQEPTQVGPVPAANQPAAAAASDPDVQTTQSLVDQALTASPPSGTATLAAFGILGAALLAAWLLYLAVGPADFTPNATYAPLAGLFVVALSIERLLEPVSGWVLPKTELKKHERDDAVAQAKNTKTHGDLADAANKQKQLDRLRSSRAVIMWAIAAALAMIAAACLGFFLLRSLGQPQVTPTKATVSVPASQPQTSAVPTDRKTGRRDPNRVLDLLITGLVVGAGTKPLHDLVTRIQASSQNTKDPAETKST